MNADVLSSIEQAVDLGVYSGHDHCVEQCDQSCKEQSADYNGDDDLDSSINISLAGCVSPFSLAASFAWNALKMSLFLIVFMLEILL